MKHVKTYSIKFPTTSQIQEKQIAVINSSMGNNEFLYPAIANGRHGRRCFCLDCRQRQVSVIVDSDLTNNQLEREFISNAEEYRRLNSLFDETLKSVVR